MILPEDVTPRALFGGLAVGTLLCCTNLYLGLQSAFITMASLQAALVGFGMLKLFSTVGSKVKAGREGESEEGGDDDDDDGEEEDTSMWQPFTAQENVVLQATAVSLGAMPLCAGLIGIVPAFNLLSPAKDGKDVHPFTFSWTALTLWCAAMAFFGIFFASPMRKPMIIQEQLRFPSGSATAQLIAVLHKTQLRNEDDAEQDQVEQRTGSTSAQPAERRPLLRRSVTELEQDQEVESGWSGLLLTFSVSAGITLAAFVFPVLYAIPAFDFVTPLHDAASRWGWYITPSLSYVGQGIIMGPQTTISLFAGAVFGWAILSPLVHHLGWTNGVPTDAEAGSQAWLLWVALAIMTSESVIGLAVLSVSQTSAFTRFFSAQEEVAEQPRSINREKERSERLTPTSWIVIGLLVSSILSSALLYILFNSTNERLVTALSPWVAPIGILLAAFLSVLAVRSLGATDLNPVNALGKLSQLAFAVLQPGNIVANMVGGALSEAGAMQAGELMQSYKTGHLIGASPRGQFFAQLVGSTAGVFVSATAYKLYERTYKLPGPEMPAPAARLWLNFARLINSGSLPPHSGDAMLIAGTLFAVTTLCKGLANALPAQTPASPAWHARLRRYTAYLPNGVAFAVGLGLNSPNYSLGRLVGGLVVLYVQRRRDAARKSQGRRTEANALPPVTLLIWSAGFVLGEGFASIVLLLLKQLGLGPLSCWGCRGGCGGGC
jgi:OPT family oligopeptide transporter